MKKKTLLLGLLFVALISIKAIENTKWKVNIDNAQISFDVAGDVEQGSISGLDAVIIFNPSDLAASSFTASVDVSSIKTGNKTRDGHLQAEKYFNADKYPKITFKSSQITSSDTGFNSTGELTIKGITNNVTIPFTFKNDVFKGEFKIHRANFGLKKKKGNEEDVIIRIHVPVTK